jgi:hypothetical protein
MWLSRGQPNVKKAPGPGELCATARLLYGQHGRAGVEKRMGCQHLVWWPVSNRPVVASTLKHFHFARKIPEIYLFLACSSVERPIQKVSNEFDGGPDGGGCWPCF